MANIKRAAEVHEKTPNEIRIVDMNFEADLDDDDTIASIVSTSITPSGELTLLGSFSGRTIQLKFTGGVKGKKYVVEALGTTTKGETVEGSGVVEVDDP